MALLTVYVDHAAADTTGDGTSGDPWKYIYQATGAIKTDAGTNQYKVWVKASATYGTDESAGTSLESDDAGHDGAGGDAGAVLYLDQAGTIVLPNVFEGYKTSIGDGGIVKIDCQGATNQLTNGIKTVIGGNVYTVFINFQCTLASADGFSLNGDDDDFATFKKCLAYNNGGAGFSGDNSILFVVCLSYNNTAEGFDVDATCQWIACISHTNTYGFFGAANCANYNCLAYNNSTHDYRHATGGARALIGGCSSDGENAANDYGIFQDAGTGHALSVVNCILFDSDYGIFSDSDSGELISSRHNVFDSSGTADTNNWLTPSLGATTPGVDGRGDIIDQGDPYIGSGTRNYDPAASVQAKGLDANWTVDFWADYNLGAGDNPPAE